VSVNWEEFATAVTSSLEWERLCGRGTYLGELIFHKTIAEYLQAATTMKIVTEHNHPDIPGNKRLDVVGFGPRGTRIQVAIEAKWIKKDGGTRAWHAEVAEDIFRLEMLSQQMATNGNDRCIVIAGVTSNVQQEFINKKKQVGKGQHMVPWIDAILPDKPATSSRRIEIRQAKLTYQQFFKERAVEVGVIQLPVSYQAQLVGHFVVKATDKDSLETYVWRISRSQNRALFTP
jgi:hypothetical protein